MKACKCPTDAMDNAVNLVFNPAYSLRWCISDILTPIPDILRRMIVGTCNVVYDCVADLHRLLLFFMIQFPVCINHTSAEVRNSSHGVWDAAVPDEISGISYALRALS